MKLDDALEIVSNYELSAKDSREPKLIEQARQLRKYIMQLADNYETALDCLQEVSIELHEAEEKLKKIIEGSKTKL